MISRIALIVPAIALAGCSAEPSEQAEHAAGSGPPARVTPDPALALPQDRLTLRAEDVESAALTGELACAFTAKGATGPLLVAAADVTDEARADGVLRHGPAIMRVLGADGGGFNAMVYGARFTGGDITVRVAVTSQIPAGDGELPPLPATLEIASDAGLQSIEGDWACGP